ncbi:non-hydrolyzing UDP-N-acetylglucosamine 2-epimerase [Asinibacterium sp. OR53]|uniref:non-hydrolyzing UDP-N-acetylglucosamine 2-epimerase n=1 Tax=Asinibacterium sp. OR53 TaxID=925409 RepID=UPI0004797354|nr:UDP-N-acetylglucosamine 2-epimerase (non-hydrolyzing) [Asinibacterium sp. OR53]
MRITIIAGARPNFMKIAPIIEAIEKHNEKAANIKYRLVHTGQHYDKNMSDSFFEQLGIPQPHVNLESGGGTQAEQTAAIMVRFEKELADHPSDVVVVVGDVTSTLACSIVAKKMHIDVVHVEAGIRSFDLSMPEEINRLVTDAITDHYFTTSDVANMNLQKAGIRENRIHFVGNTMIDTLLKNEKRFIKPPIWEASGLVAGNYFVLTLHRPANVDVEEKLKKLIQTIIDSSRGLPIIFPVHPRTGKNLQKIGIQTDQLLMINPMSYLEFNYLVKYAKAVITDSGGITEETTVMRVPCITLRNNTERPETVDIGTNELIGTDPGNLPPAFEKLFNGKWKKGTIPPLWDGKTSERIVSVLNRLYN